MKKYKYLVLGTGVGKVIAWWLLRQPDTRSVVLADKDIRAANDGVRAVWSSKAGLPPCFSTDLDVVHTPREKLIKSFATADVVISAIPAMFDPLVTRACIEAGIPACNLGGVLDATREQLTLDKEAKRADVSIVTDCGLMPGLGNVMIRYLASWFAPHMAYTITVTAGGVPLRPQNPYNYQRVYSVEGLKHMVFDRVPRLKKGEIEYLDARETFRIIDTPAILKNNDLAPFDTMEAFASSGAALAPWDMRAYGVENFVEWTVRWPGFENFIREHPAEQFDKAFVKLPPTNAEYPDLMYMAVTASVDEKKIAAFELVDTFENKTGFAAIERTTAFPAAIIARMLAQGNQLPSGVATCDQALDRVDLTKSYLAEVRQDLPFTFNGLDR